MGIIHGFQTDGAQPSPIWIYGDGQYLINYNTVLTVVTTVDTTSTIITFSQQNALTITGDPSVQLIADLKAFISSGGIVPIVQVDPLRWAIPTVVTWDGITGKPTFATVATSGSYTDLSNKPTIPPAAVWGSITGTLASQTDLQTALDAKAPTASPTFTGTATTSQLVVTGSATPLTIAGLFSSGYPTNKSLVARCTTALAAPLTPTSVTSATLVGWYAADALVLNDGDPVATWTDSSGLSHNAAKVTTNSATFKTNIQNGKPVVRFVANEGYGSTFTFTSVATVITVYQKAIGVGGFAYICDGKNADTQFQTFKTGTTASIYSGGYIDGPGCTDDGAFHILTTQSGTGGYVAQDGVKKGTGNNSASTLGGVTIGCRGQTFSNGFTGDIAEILFFNGTLSAAERAGVEMYLSNKYNIKSDSGTQQTANLQEWQNYLGTPLAYIDSLGNITTTTSVSGTIKGVPGNTVTTGITFTTAEPTMGFVYAPNTPAIQVCGRGITAFAFAMGSSVLYGNVNCVYAFSANSTLGTAYSTEGVDTGLSRISGGVVGVGNGTVGSASGKLKATTLSATGLPVYANNAAAITGGLAVGDFYRTGADPDLVCVVH